MTPHLHLRIETPRGRIGPGKIALLEAIGRAGSISGAGRALGMSYRRAWELVDQLNTLMGAPVVVTSPGGAGGGGAALTDTGARLVAEYRAIETEAERAVAGRLAGLIPGASPGEAPWPDGPEHASEQPATRTGP